MNVLREEQLRIGDRVLPVSYGNRRIAQVWKEAKVSDAELGNDQLIELPHGKGRIIWSPLPVELNDRIEPISALYQYALASAGCSEELEWAAGGQLPGVYGRKLTFEEGALYVFVSEYSHNADIEVKDPVTGVRYSFVLEKERSVLFGVDKAGQLLAVYRPNQVSIAVL